jgi:hypothetical protein
MQDNSMAAMRKLFLAFGFTVITNQPLGLDI